MILTRNNSSYYRQIKYNRWISYFWQMHHISSYAAESILELGVGDGIVSSILKTMGYSILTSDLSKEVAADVVADIRNLPFRDNSFDLVASFQVLEHLEYEDFPQCLRSLHRIARKYVLLSLPQGRKYFDFKIHLPWMKKDGSFDIYMDFPRFPPYEKPAGRNHFWEIGIKGYPLKRIVEDMERAGFSILVNRPIRQNIYHRFFVLGKG